MVVVWLLVQLRTRTSDSCMLRIWHVRLVIDWTLFKQCDSPFKFL